MQKSGSQVHPTKRITIMAGGTGGHVFPGLAVAKVLKGDGWQVDWFGTQDKIEAKIVPEHGFPIHFLPVKGIRGKSKITKLLAPFMLIKAVYHASRVLRKTKPDIVLGMGGYASGPGAIAAKIMGIPIVVHEQNAVFGLTNRVIAKFANRILTGFDVSKAPALAKAPKSSVWVGNPVREDFFTHREMGKNVDAVEGPQTSDALNILVTGGSLGALALNQVIPSVLISLGKQFPIKVWHQTGKNKSESVRASYESVDFARVEEFIDDTSVAFKWADIIICRAGALTVAEVAAVAKPAVFVPLPIAVDDHQFYNAKSLVDSSAGIVIRQSQLEEQIEKCIRALLDDSEYRSRMGENAKKLAKPNAAQQVAAVCEEVIGKK